MTNILLNNKLNGVEIYFDGKPIKEVLNKIKEVGFRWNGKKLCWYAKQSEETIAEAQKYANISSTDIIEVNQKNIIKNNYKISLWDLTRWEDLEVNNQQTTKEIAKEIKKHAKERFPFCKFSATSDHIDVNFYIKSSPFEEDSAYLKSIQDYCTKLIESYQYCTYYDPYGDYGSRYNFYDARAVIPYNYMQTEQTEEIKEAMREFDIKKVEYEEAEREREEQEYQEHLKKQEEREKKYKLRMEQEKKEVEIINNSVDVIELEEGQHYFVIGSQFADVNKNSTLEVYKEKVAKGEYYLQNVKITKEVHFKNNDSLEYFSNLLLNDFDFLQGTGGSFSDDRRLNSMTDFYNMDEEERQTVEWISKGVAIYYNNELQFVVDAQGYSYARYVGLVDNVTVQKYYNMKQVIEDEDIQEAIKNADILEDISTDIVLDNNMIDTWNKEDWEKYKELIKEELKIYNIKLNKAIIQQLPENMVDLKVAMYKLLIEVDGIQEQFKNAELQQGQKLTLFYISDLGGIVTQKITFDSVENVKYAQYENAVKITYIPQGKRKQYYSYFYSTLLVYEGWLDLPENVLNIVENRDGMTIKKSKYGSCDHQQYDEILKYFNKQGNKTIVNTYKPNFE